jgi:N-acetylneuraminate synthase
MEGLKIGARLVGRSEPPYIVAEIGSNHNGDMDLCRRMIDAAKSCGVDAVKFQSWSKSSLISSMEYRRQKNYQVSNGGGLTLEQAAERYQLTEQMHRETAEYCRANGITFFSSCFSPAEADLLESLEVPAYKIASMDINHHTLLQHVGGKGKPVILSTGLASLGEIERAVGLLRQGGCPSVLLLHCVSIYPSPAEMVHLRNMATLNSAFDLPVGYSDHTLGTAIPLAAVALGACMIEKHFTLAKSLEGWDHSISADPAEMAGFVREASMVFQALGQSSRTLAASQLEKRKVFRRRVVIKCPLPKGAILSQDCLDFKRPGTGIAPDEACYVVGRRLNRDVEADYELEWSDLD